MMKVLLSSDHDGFNLKNKVKDFLIKSHYEVEDISPVAFSDFIDATLAITDKLLSAPDAFGIIFDRTGAGSYITACKVKGIIACECSDERSAFMTRQHNNARMITIGSDIVGPGLAQNIAKEFLESHYDGGRHQIRVDMLNRMA